MNALEARAQALERYIAAWLKLSIDTRRAIETAVNVGSMNCYLNELSSLEIQCLRMLGDKVYTPYISTYTEFTLETSPDVIRLRQRKFNPYNALPHELIPSHIYFNKWEDAALYTIEYVLDKLF